MSEEWVESRREDGLIGFVLTLFYNKRVLSTILTLSVLLISGVFMLDIRREAMPNIDTGIFEVSVSYPGASSLQAEVDAVIPIEEEIKDILGIDRFTSTSYEGGARILIVLDPDAKDPDAVGDEIYRRINLSTIRDISPDVESLSIREFDPGEISVYDFGLLWKEGETSYKDLYAVGDILDDRISMLPGVSEVEIFGSRDRHVEINVDPNALREKRVSLNTVINAVRTRNVRSTSGVLEGNESENTIVVITEYQNLEEVRDTILRSGIDANRVLLRDVATVQYGFPELENFARVNQKDALILSVKKLPDADIVSTTQAVKDFLNSQKLIPDTMEWKELEDEGYEVNKTNRILLNNGFIGFLLVLLVLFVFLNFQTAFWTAFGIPITMAVTLAYMGSSGMTLNYLSMTAMIAMIGMIVDHGIVVAESIYHRKSRGFPPLRASIDGLKSVFWPVCVTVGTTILAFLPLLLISGVMGKFTRFFPVTISVMLIASFIESCLLLVSHLLHSRSKPKPPKRKPNSKHKKMGDDWFTPVIKGYQGSLYWVLRYRWASAFFCLGLLVAGVYFSIGTVTGFVLFDDSDIPQVMITYRSESGTPIEKVIERSKVLEQAIIDVTPPNQIKGIMNEIPSGVFGSLVMQLVDKEDRTLSAQEYKNLLRRTLAGYGAESRKNSVKRARLRRTSSEKREGTLDEPVEKAPDYSGIPILFDNVRVGSPGGGGPGGQAISLRFYGENQAELEEVSEKGIEVLSLIKGTMNVSSNSDRLSEQIRVLPDHEAMARYGITLSDLNNSLRAAFNGITASKSRVDGKELDYIVRLDAPYRKSVDTILNLNMRANSGAFLPISRFAEIGTTTSAARYRRYNGLRTVTVSSDIDVEAEGVTALKINDEFKERFYENVLYKYPSVTLDDSGGEAESTQEFIRDLIPAFVAAFLLILLLLILLFDSVMQSVVVMGAIPFGLVGGMVALELHGIPLGFMALLGMTGLMGVVVNDSVVMVEFINHIVKRYPLARAKVLQPMVLKGAGRRLRAVCLTTLTTVLGLVPTVYGFGGDPGFVRPVVLVLCYGLLAATLITLYFIPASYMIYLDFLNWWRNLKESFLKKPGSES